MEKEETQFNNSEYSNLVSDILINYGISTNNVKAHLVRKYVEIFVKKILDIPPEKKCLIGDHKVIDKIKKLPESSFLEPELDNIRKIGNIGSHANITIITDEEIEEIIDSLFKMMAYFFIIFFKENKFGSRPDIMSHFSLLPAIIRFYVLDYLYKTDENNIKIIDKLSMARLKAFGKDNAMEWLKNNESKFRKLKDYDEEYMNTLKKKTDPISKMKYESIMSNACHDLYEMCVKRINLLIEENNIPPFMKMEESYREFKKIEVDVNDNVIRKFMDIMEFLYLGREKVSKENIFNKCEKCNKFIIEKISSF